MKTASSVVGLLLGPDDGQKGCQSCRGNDSICLTVACPSKHFDHATNTRWVVLFVCPSCLGQKLLTNPITGMQYMS